MDIKNQEFQRRPQVLLLGNGINRAYADTAISWGRLLKSVEKGRNLPDELPVSVPMPLEAVLRTGDSIDETLKKRCAELYGRVDSPEMEAVLQRLLSMGFDDILTTNYSYELEAAAVSRPEISKYRITKSMRHTGEVSVAESRYLLYTYNELNYQGHTNRIWHIHGEARKPDSMILGHYYYGNLLYKYQELLKRRGNSYYNNQKAQKMQELGSWIDAFILGDVYILGFGMDFSEMDLWWLLNRKKRENAETGGVYYFAPAARSFDVKTELLRVYNVKVEHFGYLVPGPQKEGTGEKERQEKLAESRRMYQSFYQDALDEIEGLMRENG